MREVLRGIPLSRPRDAWRDAYSAADRHAVQALTPRLVPPPDRPPPYVAAYRNTLWERSRRSKPHSWQGGRSARCVGRTAAAAPVAGPQSVGDGRAPGRRGVASDGHSAPATATGRGAAPLAQRASVRREDHPRPRARRGTERREPPRKAPRRPCPRQRRRSAAMSRSVQRKWPVQ